MIRFFWSEDLYGYLNENEAEDLFSKIEKDKIFSFNNDKTVYFYYEEDKNEILEKYPKLDETLENNSTLKDYIGFDYEQGKDYEFNGVFIGEEFLQELAKDRVDDPEFMRGFMINPEEETDKLHKEILKFAISYQLGKVIKKVKEEAGIDDIYFNVVSDFSNLRD